MSKLIRLPNGDWVDPSKVTGIYPMPLALDNGEVFHPRVSVTSEEGGFSLVELDFDADPKAWADQFAAQVNEARS